MENNFSDPEFKKKGSHSLAWMRALTLYQWRRAEEVTKPMRNISHAGEHIDSILRDLGASGVLEEAQLNEAWRSIAGDFIYQNTQVQSIRNGNLTLRVVQPALKFQLEQMKTQLLNKITSNLGEELVKSIKFII